MASYVDSPPAVEYASGEVRVTRVHVHLHSGHPDVTFQLPLDRKRVLVRPWFRARLLLPPRCLFLSLFVLQVVPTCPWRSCDSYATI